MYFLSENYSVFGSFIIVAAFMNAQVPQFPSVKAVFTARK